MISMKHKSIIKFTIHALFWLFYIVVLFVFDPPNEGQQEIPWIEKIELDLLLMVATIAYLNDQLLLPYFFKRKSYFIYGVINVFLLSGATLFYCYFLRGLDVDMSVCFSNNLWIIALPVVFLSFIWLIFRFFDKQNELESAYQDKLELELKFLKTQINPHVLFNSLNTIYAEAIKENDTIAEMILMLSENLKYVLNQSNDVLVDLEKDISFIENHIKFTERRTQGINHIVYEKEIDSYQHSIAPLILIDLIENAFKYASYKSDRLSEIIVRLKIENGKLHFTSSNEYDVVPENEKLDTTQIGLKNLRKRLELIYKDKYELLINKDNGFFVVDLKIDLE
jgi:hypothetical protein